ncbi:MAG: hypothetical protein LLG04_01845 [Parachlamydia sp.]|nr:hypothetical protein [Parachlamydia sp.]
MSAGQPNNLDDPIKANIAGKFIALRLLWRRCWLGLTLLCQFLLQPLFFDLHQFQHFPHRI